MKINIIFSKLLIFFCFTHCGIISADNETINSDKKKYTSVKTISSSNYDKRRVVSLKILEDNLVIVREQFKQSKESFARSNNNVDLNTDQLVEDINAKLQDIYGNSDTDILDDYKKAINLFESANFAVNLKYHKVLEEQLSTPMRQIGLLAYQIELIQIYLMSFQILKQYVYIYFNKSGKRNADEYSTLYNLYYAVGCLLHDINDINSIQLDETLDNNNSQLNNITRIIDDLNTEFNRLVDIIKT